METFKQVLAFPLYATTAWLAWVLGAQSGNDAVLALLLGLVLVALGAWLYGRGTRAGAKVEAAIALAIALAGVVVAWPPRNAAGSEASLASRSEAGWEAWSPEKVQDLLAQGRPVFVDFTAAWCVTCQVNKRVALHDAEVSKMFEARGVVRLTADWTRQDARITQALASLGRNAVPVYALYSPGEEAPRLLPEVLTPSLVLGEISRLPAAKVATASQR
jgi:thiol:disulfide interchange protein DsbD